MTDTETTYELRPVTPDDLPLLEGWLRQPHVVEWWGDDVLGSLEEIVEAAEGVDTEPLIVELDGAPIAYLEIYDPHLEEDHPYQDQPFGTLGLDLTIGEPALLSKGHGSAILSQVAEQLFAEGAPQLIFDPHPDNIRAIKAAAKAGFTETERHNAVEGAVILMAKMNPDEDQENDGPEDAPEDDEGLTPH